MVTIEAAQEGAYLLGVALAAIVSSVFPTPQALMSVGAITCIAALVGYRMLPRADVGLPVEGAEPNELDAMALKERRTRPNALGGAPVAYWMSAPTPPWTVDRQGSVAHLSLRWPLVASDWDAIVHELSEAIDDGARAVILPTSLPPGSRVPGRQLDQLWAALMDMSITVKRAEEENGSPAGVPVLGARAGPSSG